LVHVAHDVAFGVDLVDEAGKIPRCLNEVAIVEIGAFPPAD
jgi:hypothetical protein